MCKAEKAYVADGNRKKVADLVLDHPAMLPKGEAKFGLSSAGIRANDQPRSMLTVGVLGKGEAVGK